MRLSNVSRWLILLSVISEYLVMLFVLYSAWGSKSTQISNADLLIVHTMAIGIVAHIPIKIALETWPLVLVFRKHLQVGVGWLLGARGIEVLVSYVASGIIAMDMIPTDFIVTHVIGCIAIYSWLWFPFALWCVLIQIIALAFSRDKLNSRSSDE